MIGLFSFESFQTPEPTEPVFDHRAVQDKLLGCMETGHHGAAREVLEEYAVDYPDKAEALRLSLVRLYGTGL